MTSASTGDETEQSASGGGGFFSRLSHPARILLVMGTIIVALAALGVLQANRSNEIEKAEAVEIAKEQVDFEVNDFSVRFLRSGVRLDPTWIISLSHVDDAGERVKLSVVQVSAVTGEVMKVSNER